MTMMGSAESVATAQHFVKERLKEIEARDLPACLPAYLLTTAYVRRTRYSLVYLASTCLTYLPPCSPKAHNAQRAAGGGGALTQGASHSVAPHSAMGAPQVTPHPRPPLPPHCTQTGTRCTPCLPNLCFTSRRTSAHTFALHRAAAGLRGASLCAAGLPTAGLLAAAAVALPATQHAQYAAGHAAHPHGAAVQHEHDVRRPVRTVSAVAVRPARHAVGIV